MARSGWRVHVHGLRQAQYFAHERVTYIGLYAFTLFGSNYFAPLVAGVSQGHILEYLNADNEWLQFINDGQGWGWVMYWSAIWNAGGFLILFFLMEEVRLDCRTSYTLALWRVGF